MRVEIEADPLDVEVDAFALVDELAQTLGAYYPQQLLRGQRPDGGALPTNSKGRPLGLGNGTIAINWWIEPATGDESRAESSTGPFQEGGYFYAVRAMVENDANPVSSDGRAGELIAMIIDRAADEAVGL